MLGKLKAMRLCSEISRKVASSSVWKVEKGRFPARNEVNSLFASWMRCGVLQRNVGGWGSVAVDEILGISPWFDVRADSSKNSWGLMMAPSGKLQVGGRMKVSCGGGEVS